MVRTALQKCQARKGSQKRRRELAARLGGRAGRRLACRVRFATVMLGGSSSSTIVPLTPHQGAGSLTAEDWESAALRQARPAAEAGTGVFIV